ncbi:MAG TPA: thermonuclease family protein [Pyrinomonadaceae bacterium]|nr:thermonuclease family protein [Pyrinomonadaceae bacterium]
MGKRQTLGLQNRNKETLVMCFLFLAAGLACSLFSNTDRNVYITSNENNSAAVTGGCPAGAEDRQRVNGVVYRVSDGDTVTVRETNSNRHTIRLFAIDAPENGQDFSQASKSNLSSLILNKPVCVAIIEKDQYGREVGIVYLSGEDMNMAQVSAGMAWHYKSHEHQQTATDRWMYSKAEDHARSKSRGLWKQAATAVPPWEYRKLGRNRRSELVK